ncbi:hypothetical protein M23134_04742 [Microscilla marina ATCC 23134]|uniref:Uncharacterized protein n=1 Tax=Microscilla marina ATCC 23134 TaxID=313606 RepID=A1ZRG4_MICM2|nr:hypothetical protein M23134_04742 [Microscilla marina ATCC 23134]
MRRNNYPKNFVFIPTLPATDCLISYKISKRLRTIFPSN